jgi:hypothetical protein
MFIGDSENTVLKRLTVALYYRYEAVRTFVVGFSFTVFAVPAGHNPLRLDVFAGTLYWTTQTMDQMMTADQLGQNDVTVLLSGQSTIGPLRLTHWLRYGVISEFQ